MSESSKYSVVTSGKLLADFDPEQVRDSVAALFKIAPEKAELLLRREQIVKKQVDLNIARAYKKRLESIGLAVALREHRPASMETSAPQAPISGAAMSLAPMDIQREPALAPISDTDASASDRLDCPKCNAPQPVVNEQCQACGALLRSAPPGLAERPDGTSRHNAEPQVDIVHADEHGLMSKSLLAGAGAALLGALVWGFVANTFGYEYGFIAWGIGGLIGFTMVSTGSSGLPAGIAAALFALLAIFGGKYMAYSGFEAELAEIVSQSQEELQKLYIDEMVAVVGYKHVSDETSLREFMARHEYTEFENANAVSADEISSFRREIVPRLERYGTAQPSFEQWYQETFEQEFANISTFQLIKANFGFLDVIFLLLGLGTAFRLAYGEG